MRKSAKPTEVAANDKEATEELIEAVRSLSNEVAGLTGHIQLLREAIDDVRAEFEWTIRNLQRPAWRPNQTSSADTPPEPVPAAGKLETATQDGRRPAPQAAVP